jgi:hypothetical protein
MPGHGSSPAHGDAERIKRTPPSAEVFALLWELSNCLERNSAKFSFLMRR